MRTQLGRVFKYLLPAILFLHVQECESQNITECSFGLGSVFPCNCEDPAEVCDVITGTCTECKDGPPVTKGQWWKGHGCRIGNIAYSKTVTSSSSRAGFGPELAVDGDVNPDADAGKCFMANGPTDVPQWLMVDLGEPAAVFMITLYNIDGGRTGFDYSFLNYAQLYVSNSSDIDSHTVLCGSAQFVEKASSKNIPCSTGLVGQYVSLKNGVLGHIQHSEFALCEMAVIGAFQPEFDECCSNPCLNGATCIDGLLDVECKCAAGFGGKFCQYPESSCSDDTWDAYAEGFTCYRHMGVDVENTKSDAQAACQGLGGHLPIINSEGEKDFVASLLASKNMSETWLDLQRGKNRTPPADCKGSDFDCTKLGWTWSDGTDYKYPHADWWSGLDGRYPEPQMRSNRALLTPPGNWGPVGLFFGVQLQTSELQYFCEREYYTLPPTTTPDPSATNTTTTTSSTTIDAKIDQSTDGQVISESITSNPTGAGKNPVQDENAYKVVGSDLETNNGSRNDSDDEVKDSPGPLDALPGGYVTLYVICSCIPVLLILVVCITLFCIRRKRDEEKKKEPQDLKAFHERQINRKSDI